jgi:hypothetical protein
LIAGSHDGEKENGVRVVSGVVFAEPGVLEGVRVVDFMGLGEEEPKVAEGFPKNKFELRNGVLIGDWSSKVSNERVDRCLG